MALGLLVAWADRGVEAPERVVPIRLLAMGEEEVPAAALDAAQAARPAKAASVRRPPRPESPAPEARAESGPIAEVALAPPEPDPTPQPAAPEASPRVESQAEAGPEQAEAGPETADAGLAPAVSAGPGTLAAALAAAPGAGSGASETDELLAYVELVRSRILAHKRYPALARRRGLEGSVTVRLWIDPSGRLRNARATGSAPAVLVAPTLDAVREAGPFPPPPPDLGPIEVALRYRLTD